MLKIKKPKKHTYYSAYKEPKDSSLKFLITNRNSPIKSYTVKLSYDLKFLIRFLNSKNESFIEKNFDSKNVIFICDPNRKLGYISFKFDLSRKEYIKQFLLKFSPPDFSDFVLKSIGDKTTTKSTSCIVITREKYLKALNPVTM